MQESNQYILPHLVYSEELDLLSKLAKKVEIQTEKVMEVLIDTNIILDWFLKRDQFYENSKAVLNKCWFGN